MSRQSLMRRLDQAEAALNEGTTMLRLDDGSTVRVDMAADITLLMDVLRARQAAREAGQDDEMVTLDDPLVPLFARSVPQGGEGQLREMTRAYCRRMLGL